MLNAFVERGLAVLVPFGGGHPYDLALHVGGAAFLRIQCKTAWLRGRCLVFNSHSTDHGRGQVSYVGLADAFGIYAPATRAVYLVPVEGVGSSEGRLRLTPTLNNQRKRIRFAADYEIGAWTIDGLRDLACVTGPAGVQPRAA